MQPPPSHDAPPAEFLGRARAFRASIDAEDAKIGALIASIIAPLRTRMRNRKKGHHFRQDSLIDVARRWQREIPSAGRLDLSVDLRDGELHVHELRVSAGEFKFREWGEFARNEADLGIVECNLVAMPGKLRCWNTMLASVGLHAGARRFERSRDQSHDAMRCDLLAVARAHPRLIDDPAIKFRIDANDGCWVGETTLTTLPTLGKELRVLSVRSFLSDDMVY